MIGELTIEQYQLAATSIGAVAGVMALAALFFAVARNRVAEAQRPAVTVAAVICGVAAFHYVLAIFEWRGGFVFDAGRYVPSEHPFVNTSRYADWVVTLPLLAVQILLLLDLPRPKAIRFGVQLVVASLLMLALGYPGEVATDNGTKLFFLALGAVPLAYVVFLLWFRLTVALEGLDPRIDGEVSTARLVMLASWMLYPVAYLFPVFGWDQGWGEALRQTFYGVADLISKPLFGLLILNAALAMTEQATQSGADPLPPLPDRDDSAIGASTESA